MFTSFETHKSPFSQGHQISSLVWSQDGNHLFAGDERGLVTQCACSGRNQSAPSFTVVQADSPVIQLEVTGSSSVSTAPFTLCISTLTRTMLCDLRNPMSAAECQVGSKARNGAYGACFQGRRAVLCTRPGMPTLGCMLFVLCWLCGK